ncbi:MAG TPA: sigma-54 dependent transcriptional regulator [Terriglobales bacterium]|nr:sigma-54 dependent transcriptional regulator [Terriglobales bacterium]
MAKYKILVVDDDEAIRFAVQDYLEAHGFDVAEAGNCRAAEDKFRGLRPEAALLDYSLPDGTALDLLPRLRAIDPNVPLIVLTAHGSIDLAVRAIKEGAEQFLTKPVELPAVLVVLQRALENQRNRQRQVAGKTRQAREAIDPFFGSSSAIRELAESASKVAASESPVLIRGETGTGKGVLARWLHANGPRSEEPFVDLNCAGLNRDFLETELFGHEKGAFTGAVSAKQGLLEVAHRGTIFLDEIGDVDLQVQPKLLKVLEEKSFRRLGEVRDRRVDIRLIAATHQDLAALGKEGRFRSDLYFRISTVPLRVPALRERKEDIPVLAEHLLQRLAADLSRPRLGLAPDAMDSLRTYSWPGNIRELRNVLERAALLSGESEIRRRDLYFEAASALPTTVADESALTLVELERRHIERVLAQEQGRVEQAARKLGIPRSTLYERIKKYGLASSKS